MLAKPEITKCKVFEIGIPTKCKVFETGIPTKCKVFETGISHEMQGF